MKKPLTVAVARISGSVSKKENHEEIPYGAATGDTPW